MIDRDSRFRVVGQAQSPEGLIGLVQAHAPDIVVTDYNMPGDGTVGDGLKLISHPSQNFRACRMLILTMVSNPSIIAAMYRKGASGVVLKSGDPREFEVIRLFAADHSVSSIAMRVNRSSKTVSTQKVSAMRKLGTRSDQELIAYCLQSELFL